MFKNNHNPPRPRPHWRTAALGTVFGATVLAAGLLTVALAIDPQNPFEIDGNADDDAALGTDWAAELPLNGPGETFIIDQIPTVATERYFTGGGSKDDAPISGWKSTSGNPTPNKNNITNAYAKAMVDPSNGHLILYFGADRYDDEGDAAMGFWFFENDVTLSGDNFTGVHTNNDLLVQVDYLNGGSQAEIQIFRWQADGTGTHGSPKKVLKEIGFGSGSGNSVVCNTTGPAPNSACVTTNNGNITKYWTHIPADPSPAGVIPQRHFIEGAVDVTALFGNVCFSSFMAETRSSHSETAQLKDFALGTFELCNIELANKDCDTVPNVSPLYDPVTDLFQTRHTVTIQNGFGTVYNVELQDNSVGSGTTCDIVQINGQNVANVPFATGSSWVNVANSLAANASMTVGILCQSSLNPLVNTVTVRASATQGGAPIAPDADDTFSENASDPDVEACQVNLTPLLDVTKECKSLTLHPQTFKPQACVTVSVSNPVESKQTIDITSFTNFLGPDGVSSPNSASILAAFQAANGNSLALPNNGTPVAFDVCYEPTGPDNGETDPGKVAYSDTVKVVGIGRANDTEAMDVASTSCPLCPKCENCGDNN